MAAKKKITPAKKDVQPKPRLNESKKTPLTPQQVKAKKYVEKSRAAKSKSGDLGSERSVMRQVNRINNVDRERQKNNPDFKGIFSYTSRDKKGNLKANWDNYISLDGKLGRPKNLRLSAKPAEKNKKKK